MNLLWIFAFLIAERLFELAFSRRNFLRLQARGGQEFHRRTFAPIALLHALFLTCLLIESYPWRIPLDLRTWATLLPLVALQGVRYWCMASLGEYWNARIVVVPGAQVRRRGPYRWLRHPNYLVVVLEFALIPLLMRAPWCLGFFFVNLLILRQRIRLEEETLRRFTDYSERFPPSSPPSSPESSG